jgi:hypothetical protein
MGMVVGLSLLFVPLAEGQQEETGWSAPEVVARTSGTLSPMVLVADRAGGLHMFFSHKPDEASGVSIDYTSWNGSEWSQPVDVLVTGMADGAALRGAVIDSRQVVHLLWLDQGRALMHSSAEVARASSPWAWSSPQKVAAGLVSGDISVGPDDTLYVVYGDPAITDSVSLVISTDGGGRWLESQQLASSGSGEVAIGEVSVAVDDEGRLHTVWAEYALPDGWPPAGVFYARGSEDAADSPLVLQVAGEGYGHPGVSTIGEEEVHLVWSSGVGGDGAFHSWSSDGGESWSRPDIYGGGRGLAGQPSFAVDSAERLHYVLGHARYAVWDGGRLSEYQDLRPAELVAQVEGSNGERAELAITSGNRVHVVFESDFDKIWYTSRQLDVPPLPTEPIAAMVTTAAPTETPAAPPTTAAGTTPAPTKVAQRSVVESPARSLPSAAPTAVGVGAATIIVVMVTLFILVRRGRV